MSSLKVIGGHIHHVYYCPEIRNNKTRSWKLRDNEQGWKEAKKKLREYERLKALGIDMYAQEQQAKEAKKRTNVKISSLPDLYFEKSGLKGESQKLYRYAVKILVDAVGDLPLWSVHEAEMRAFEAYIKTLKKTSHSVKIDPVTKEKTVKTKILDAPLAYNTQANITRHLSILFRFAEREGLIDKCYFEEWEPKNKRPKKVPLKALKEVLGHLRNKDDKEHYFCIMAMLITGFRISTICALKWSDIDWEDNIINVPNVKGDREDNFPMPKLLQRILTLQKERNLDYPGNKIFKFKSRTSFGFWDRALKIKKLDHYKRHQIRKTFVSMLGNGGMMLDDVAYLAGHKDKRTTQDFYLDRDLKRLRGEMDKVFDLEFGKDFNTIFNTTASKNK